jgi:hypothetical protein
MHIDPDADPLRMPRCDFRGEKLAFLDYISYNNSAFDLAVPAISNPALA